MNDFPAFELLDWNHGPDCLCPGETCRSWIETNAGLGFHSDGTPREPHPDRRRCPAGCGRFVGKDGRCSLERRVYRDGSFAGWEHY